MGAWYSLGTVCFVFSLKKKFYLANDRRNPTDTGMQRLTLSEEDRHVRDWFVQTMSGLGCNITIDQLGNIFAVRPGRRANVPATFIGSHLDTQPTGGRYDGILGVLAGVEAVKTMVDLGLETEGGIGVVNWTK